MKIPLIDLSKQISDLQDDLVPAVNDVLLRGHYILGKEVTKFESALMEYLNVDHVIGVGNGTDALILVLKAMGIGEGDEVITTPYTFFATAESISYVGATPVFVDVEKDSFNMNASLIEAKITDKTKAIMPVHIFGLSCDMTAISKIAKKHGLLVIEDACQAIGAKHNGEMIGSLSDATCFSFFPTKNLGCAGDGGAITTNNKDLATIIRALRAHGSGELGREAYELMTGESVVLEVTETTEDKSIYDPRKYYNYLIAQNSRLDEIQAAVLNVKLPHLDGWNQRRRELAARYTDKLSGTSLILPQDFSEEHVYHLYIVETDHRTELVSYLSKYGISTGVYYPVPLHQQKAYASLPYVKGELDISEHLSKRTMALPLFVDMTEEQQDYVIAKVLEFENR